MDGAALSEEAAQLVAALDQLVLDGLMAPDEALGVHGSCADIVMRLGAPLDRPTLACSSCARMPALLHDPQSWHGRHSRRQRSCGLVRCSVSQTHHCAHDGSHGSKPGLYRRSQNLRGNARVDIVRILPGACSFAIRGCYGARKHALSLSVSHLLPCTLLVNSLHGHQAAHVLALLIKQHVCHGAGQCKVADKSCNTALGVIATQHETVDVSAAVEAMLACMRSLCASWLPAVHAEC